MLKLALSSAALAVLAVGASAATIVDWSGTGIVTANANLRNGASVSSDFDGDGDIDIRFAYQNQTGTRLNPTTGGYAAQPFYGGVWSEVTGATGSPTFDGASVVNDNTLGDAFDLRAQNNAPRAGNLHMVLFFDKGDFFAGGSSVTNKVVFDSASSLSFGTFSKFENLGDVRWLVRDGGQFYVSQELVANTTAGKVLTGAEIAAINWAAYNPAAAFNMNFDQSAAVFAPHTFADVTAFGFIVDKDVLNSTRQWITYRGFQAVASVVPIPEPASLALLGVAGLLAGRRRF
jgi:hypothetical protein